MSADTPLGTAFTYIGGVNFLPLSEITYSTNFFFERLLYASPCSRYRRHKDKSLLDPAHGIRTFLGKVMVK